jgi:hypothetical protein
VLVGAGFVGAVGLFLLVGQLFLEVRGREVLARGLMTSIGLFLLYICVGMATEAGRVVALLSDDGIRYFPSRWPVLRRRGHTFIRWEEIGLLRDVHSRGARVLDIYTKDSPPHKTRGLVNFYRLRPAMRLPVQYLDFPEPELVREIRERAWKRGVTIRR